MDRDIPFSVMIWSCTAAALAIAWYFWNDNKRSQEQHNIGKANSQWFMDKVKTQDMEQGLEFG